MKFYNRVVIAREVEKLAVGGGALGEADFAAGNEGEPGDRAAAFGRLVQRLGPEALDYLVGVISLLHPETDGKVLRESQTDRLHERLQQIKTKRRTVIISRYPFRKA